MLRHVKEGHLNFVNVTFGFKEKTSGPPATGGRRAFASQHCTRGQRWRCEKNGSGAKCSEVVVTVGHGRVGWRCSVFKCG